jgi:hypothetical protein
MPICCVELSATLSLASWLPELFEWLVEGAISGAISTVTWYVIDKVLRSRNSRFHAKLSKVMIEVVEEDEREKKIVRVTFINNDGSPSPTPNSHSSAIILTKIPPSFLGI